MDNDIKTNRTEREEYIDNLTAKLKEWDRDLEKIEKRIDKLVGDLKIKNNERLSKVKVRRKELKEKLNKLEASGELALQPVKEDLERLWNDTKIGLKRIRDELKS